VDACFAKAMTACAAVTPAGKYPVAFVTSKCDSAYTKGFNVAFEGDDSGYAHQWNMSWTTTRCLASVPAYNLCPFDQFCSSSEQCGPKIAVGAVCNSSYEASFGSLAQCKQEVFFSAAQYGCSNVSNTCVMEKGFKNTNDGCSLGTECASGTCNGGKCAGLARNAVCTRTGACAFGDYCNAVSRTCVARPAANAACTDNALLESVDDEGDTETGDPCPYLYICSSGSCKRLSASNGTAGYVFWIVFPFPPSCCETICNLPRPLTPPHPAPKTKQQFAVRGQ
jgi:hypothetical protein